MLAEQLTRAGFNAEEQLDTANQWARAAPDGRGRHAVAFVHCGSLYDPYDTHGAVPQQVHRPRGRDGQPGGGIFACHRYVGDPAMDAALDKMEQPTSLRPPTPSTSRWVKTAVDTYLRDMPTIVLAEELHVITMNEEFWTGWPNEDDPYIAPYPCWNDFTLVGLSRQADPVSTLFEPQRGHPVANTGCPLPTTTGRKSVVSRAFPVDRHGAIAVVETAATIPDLV